MRRLALLVLALVGFGVAGSTVFLWPTPSDTTYYLDATPVSDAQIGDGPVVTYANLSADNQRLFDRALGPESANVGSETTPLNARYVSYDGTTYQTTVRAAAPDDGGGARLALLGLGALATLLGTFAIVGLLAVSWDRERTPAEDRGEQTGETLGRDGSR